MPLYEQKQRTSISLYEEESVLTLQPAMSTHLIISTVIPYLSE